MSYDRYAPFVNAHIFDDLYNVVKARKGDVGVKHFEYTQAGKSGNTVTFIDIQPAFDYVIVQVSEADGWGEEAPTFIEIYNIDPGTAEDQMIGVARFKLGRIGIAPVWIKAGTKYRIIPIGTEAKWTDARSITFSGFLLGNYTKSQLKATLL